MKDMKEITLKNAWGYWLPITGLVSGQ